MISKAMEIYNKYKEIILYIFFGGTTTIVNWCVYVSVINIWDSTLVANTVAWSCAVIFAFFVNKLLVFRSTSMDMRVIVKESIFFFLTRFVSGMMEIFGPELLINIGLRKSIFGIKGAVAKVIVSVLVIVSNYVLSKILVFRKSTKELKEIS